MNCPFLHGKVCSLVCVADTMKQKLDSMRRNFTNTNSMESKQSFNDSKEWRGMPFMTGCFHPFFIGIKVFQCNQC
jgi:hypothetical protein